jgi:hypothetical protein
MSEVLTVTEMARRGGHARAAALTADQRRASSHRANLARAFQKVVDHWPELDPRQRDRLRRLLQDPEEAA